MRGYVTQTQHFEIPNNNANFHFKKGKSKQYYDGHLGLREMYEKIKSFLDPYLLNNQSGFLKCL